MKRVRPLLIGLAVVAVLLVTAIATAFTPTFQTWAARRALASRPDVKGTIGSVSAGTRKVAAKDVRLEQNGAVLTLPSVEAELPVVSAGFSKKVFVSRLVAKGWVLDLSRAAPAPAKKTTVSIAPRRSEFSLLSSAYAADPSAPATTTTTTVAPIVTPIFTGIFSQLQLPVEFSLDGVELEGELILPAPPDHPPTRLKVTLYGGGLAVAHEGKFVFSVTTAAAAGVAPVSAVGLRGTLTATMDTSHSFTRLAAVAEASASGTQFPRGVKLNADIAATRDSKGENYAVTIAGEGRELASLQADFPIAGRTSPNSKLTGAWKLDVRDADLAPFSLGIALPTFQAIGDGNFETDAAATEIHANGKLNATADKLAAIAPELEAVGAMRVVAEFEGAFRSEVIRVDRFSAEFFGAKPVATVRALQAFEFNPKTTDLKVADPAHDLLGVTLQGVPLGWLKPFLRDIVLTGGDLTGDLAASARDGGVTLRAKTPLSIAGLSVEQGGKLLLREVDLVVTPSADYTPQGWQAVIAPLSLKTGSVTLLTLEAKAGQRAGKDQPMKATGTLAVNLVSALAQPAIAQAAQLQSGDVSVEWAGSFGVRQELQAKLVVRNLAADPTLAAEKLPTLTADLRADREAAGKITFNAPVIVERDARKSDLNLTGTLLPEKSGMNFDAHVTSALLVIDDLKIFAAPFGSAPTTATEESKKPSEPTRDSAPPWAGIKGKATLALQKIMYSDSFEATNVTGTLVLDEAGVKLQGMRTVTNQEGVLELNGSVSFDAKQPEPYVLSADFVAKGFNPAPLLSALNPAVLPTVEGKMNMNSKVTGSAKTLDQLPVRARGKFEVNSKAGIFRGLTAALPKEKVQATQTTLALVGGFFGASSNKEISTLSEIFTKLSEISYDQLSVKAERDDQGNLVLSDFSLIAPEVRLAGVGRITYSPAKSFFQQSLDLQLNLSARGWMGDALGQLKLLKPEKDALGYTAFSTPIKVGGSLSKTDLGDLPLRLLQLVLEKTGLLEKASDALNKLLGK